MKILIADDDDTLCSILKMIIEKQGHEVVVTRNGAQAWQAMREPGAPRIAILDWMMPEMDGMEACRRIREMDPDAPPHIIMLTAREAKADIVTALNAGADDYLIKPFDPGELIARINVGCRLVEMQNKLLQMRNDVAHEARHDPLTGIFNRRAIFENLSREVSRQGREHRSLAVGICDLDYFKRVNDEQGHLVGDEVLCGFVRLIERSLREYDYLGRLGGDEFAVISSSARSENFYLLYERLRAVAAGSPIPAGQGSIAITVSIGVAIWSPQMTEYDLLAAADVALYQAKKRGRNCVYPEVP